MTTTIDPRRAVEFDPISAVREATQKVGTARPGSARFSLSTASSNETTTAVLFGIYLAYAVGRLPEVFDFFDVTRLPMIMMAGFLLILGFTVPAAMWQELWQRSKAMRLVTALGVLGLVTAPTGIWASNSVLFFRTRYIISLAVFYCSVVFLRDRRNLRRAIVIFVICMACISIDTLYEFNKVSYDEFGNAVSLQSVFSEKTRLTVGVSLDPNDFGAILAMTLPLALWLGVGSTGRRIFWSIIALILCAAIVPTASRGAMLASGAAATALIGLGGRGWRRWVTFIMVAIGAVLFIKTANSGQMDRFTTFGANDYNMTASDGRWRIWKQGIIWTLKRPWGHGLDNFTMQYDMVLGNGRAAHSAWVQYGVELGVAGLAIFVLLCATLLRQLKQIRDRAVKLARFDPSMQEEEAFAGHMVAMLVGLLVASTFLSVAFQPILYMGLGVAAAGVLGTRVPEDQQQSPVITAAEPAPIRQQVRRARLKTTPISRSS